MWFEKQGGSKCYLSSTYPCLSEWHFHILTWSNYFPTEYFPRVWKIFFKSKFSKRISPKTVFFESAVLKSVFSKSLFFKVYWAQTCLLQSLPGCTASSELLQACFWVTKEADLIRAQRAQGKTWFYIFLQHSGAKWPISCPCVVGDYFLPGIAFTEEKRHFQVEFL